MSQAEASALQQQQYYQWYQQYSYTYPYSYYYPMVSAGPLCPHPPGPTLLAPDPSQHAALLGAWEGHPHVAAMAPLAGLLEACLRCFFNNIHGKLLHLCSGELGGRARAAPEPALPPCLPQNVYQSYGSPSQYGMGGSYGSATPQQPSAPQHQGSMNQVTQHRHPLRRLRGVSCRAAPGPQVRTGRSVRDRVGVWLRPGLRWGSWCPACSLT